MKNRKSLKDFEPIANIIIAVMAVIMGFYGIYQSNHGIRRQNKEFELEHRPYISFFLSPRHLIEHKGGTTIKIPFTIYDLSLKNNGIFPANITSIKYIYLLPNGQSDTTLRTYNNGVIVAHNSETKVSTRGLSKNINGTHVKVIVRYDCPIFDDKYKSYVSEMEFVHKYNGKKYKIISNMIK